jgi:hypothetical protein
MNHLFNLKPWFQQIVEKQRVAQHRLFSDKTTRSEPEMAHYRRSLQPVPLADLDLPKLPLVRLTDSTTRYVLLGEVAQTPGTAVLFDPATATIDISYKVAQLELVSPSDL